MLWYDALTMTIVCVNERGKEEAGVKSWRAKSGPHHVIIDLGSKAARSRHDGTAALIGDQSCDYSASRQSPRILNALASTIPAARHLFARSGWHLSANCCR